MYSFKAEQLLPIGRTRAWDFFSNPKNLKLITPPEMDFNILSKLESNEIYEGMIIDYTVKPLLGIPVLWQTKIIKVQSKSYFIDKQIKGPYKYWEHSHTFSENTNGVLMTDVVNYELSLGYLGKMAESLFVRRKIESIFEYRKNVIDKIFN